MKSLWQVTQTLWIQLVTFHSTSVLRLSLHCSPLSWNVQNQERKGLCPLLPVMKTSTSISPAPFWEPQISTPHVFLFLLWKRQEFNVKWNAAISKEEMNQSMRPSEGQICEGEIRVAVITQQQWVRTDWVGVSRWFWVAVGIARCDRMSEDLIEMMVSDRIFSNLPQRAGGWRGRAKTDCRWMLQTVCISAIRVGRDFFLWLHWIIMWLHNLSLWWCHKETMASHRNEH